MVVIRVGSGSNSGPNAHNCRACVERIWRWSTPSLPVSLHPDTVSNGKALRLLSGIIGTSVTHRTHDIDAVRSIDRDASHRDADDHCLSGRHLCALTILASSA